MPLLSPGVSAFHPPPWSPWSRAHGVPCQTEVQCVSRVPLLQNSLPFHCPAQEVEKVKISIFCLNSCCDSVSDRSLFFFFPPSRVEFELETQGREAEDVEHFGCATGEDHFATSTLVWPWGQAALGAGPERGLISCRVERQVSLKASPSWPPCLPPRATDTHLPLPYFCVSPTCSQLITSGLCSWLS